MWLVPSRSRPYNLGRLIKACRRTGMTTPAAVRLDSDDPCIGGYMSIETDWEMVVGDRVPLSEAYNEFFGRRLPWYGIFADDVLPETPRWDVRLIEAAGNDGVAYGDDGIGDKPTHFVIGGGLAEEIGWLALPGLTRTYIDTVWNDIASARGVLRYLPDVKITHLHFSNGRALMDSIYRKPEKDADKAIYEQWRVA